MTERGSALELVAEIAGDSWGLLTTGQAEQRGLSRPRLGRLVANGVLERIDQGVYHLIGSGTDHLEAKAAWLVLDPLRPTSDRIRDLVPAAVASHATAADLHGIGDLRPGAPEFTVPARRQSRRGTRFHVATLDPSDITLVDSLPTTTVERTIVDLVAAGHDLEHIAQVLADALDAKTVDTDELAQRLDPVAHQRAADSGDELLERLLTLAGYDLDTITSTVAESPVGQRIAASALSAVAAAIANARPSIAEIVTKDLDEHDAALGKLMAARALSELIRLDMPTTAMLAQAWKSAAEFATGPAVAEAFRTARFAPPITLATSMKGVVTANVLAQSWKTAFEAAAASAPNGNPLPGAASPEAGEEDAETEQHGRDE